MFSIFSRPAALSACLVFILFGTAAAYAAPSDDTARTAALAQFVERALAANPRVQAAAAAADAEAARSQGASRPLFNPGLELEYENSDIDLTTLELSQTLDWHDKRSARKSAADAGLEAARAGLQSLREQLTGEILTALADLDRASRLRNLAAERVELLKRFVSLHQRRAAAGDIGQTELQLAHLALAEARLQYADAATEAVESRTALSRLTGAVPASPLAFPAVIPTPSLEPGGTEGMAANHPAVREARLHALAAERRIRMSDLDRRADPTIGIKGGREDRETLIGLRLEIPLQVRNDYSEQVDAARAEALKAEREAQDTFRNVLSQLEGAHRRLVLTRESLTQWRSQGQPSLKGYASLLEKLWKAGEVGTTEYLVQLRQALDTRVAGEALQGKAWLAWADWLSAAGRVQKWLGIRTVGGAQ